MMKFRISKQIIISGGQVIAVSRVVLVYEVIVVNSRLGNCIHRTGLPYWN